MLNTHFARRTLMSAAALTALSIGSSAMAGFIEFTSSVTLTPLAPPTAVGSTVVAGTTSLTTNGYTYNAVTSTLTTAAGNKVRLVALQTNPAPLHTNANVGSDFVFGQIELLDLSFPTETISFNYDFTLNFTDYTAVNSPAAIPGGTGSIHVTGRVTGTLGNFAVNLSNFNYVTVPANGLFSTAAGETFKVTPVNYTNPGPENLGTFSANIIVVPEPTSMAFLAAPAALLLRRRRS